MIPSNIERKHIVKAIREIDSNGIPPKRESKKFLLIFEGKQYPPKYVLSLANKFANREELDPSRFTGGQETNSFLEKLGVDIMKVSSRAIGKSICSQRKTLIDEGKKQSDLERLLHKVSLSNIDIIKHHIKHAEEHYQNSNYDDSISNSRKFFEAVLQQVANGFNVKKYGRTLNKDTLKKPWKVRNFLVKEGLIMEDGKGVFQEAYRFFSTTGSHPYKADKDQAKFALGLAQDTSHFVLSKYIGFLERGSV